jgi:hypothetical protein
MKELTTLIGTLGVPVIVVLLILDKVKGIMNNRNGRPSQSTGNPVVQEDLKDLLQRMFDHQERQDGKVTEQLGRQTQVMRDISNVQAKMYTCLEKLEEKL